MEHRWGTEIVNVAEKSLPGLKVQYILDLIKGKNELALLEIGSGEGKILNTIRQFNKNLQLFGCDIKRPQSREAYHFSLLTEETLPYENDRFDIVLMIDCLEHVSNYKKYLEEISRVLKKGALFHCFVPCEGELLSAYSFYELILGNDVYAKTKEHVNSFKKAEIAEEIRTFFTIKKISYSYHLIGHCMDATLFALTLNQAIGKTFWNENKYYTKGAKSVRGIILNALLTFANAIAFSESRVFKNTKQFAYGMHITSVK